MTMTSADAVSDDEAMAPRAERPKRRRFTTEYKAAILAEYESAERTERGVILRRECLYSSHLAEWRKAAEAAEAGAQAGLRPAAKDRRDREIEALQDRAQRAEAELARTKAALDLVGKAHALLETI